MLLREFFGRSLDIKQDKKNHEGKEWEDDLFWFILDHDRLHKDYFHPLAAKVKANHDKKDFNKETYVKELMPMVEKGCKEFYSNKKMNGQLGKLFPKELRDGMCERLFDHYFDDILKDKYKIK